MTREKKKKGKGKKCYLPILTIILALSLISCATLSKQPEDKFAYNAYGVISIAVATVDLIDSVFYSLRASREVSDSAWATYEKVANKTIDNISAASRAMALYKRGGTTKEIAELAVKALTVALNDLESYYMAQIPESKRKPLIR